MCITSMNKRLLPSYHSPHPKTHTRMYIQHPELFSPSLNRVLLYSCRHSGTMHPGIQAREGQHPTSLLSFSPYLIQWLSLSDFSPCMFLESFFSFRFATTALVIVPYRTAAEPFQPVSLSLVYTPPKPQPQVRSFHSPVTTLQWLSIP